MGVGGELTSDTVTAVESLGIMLVILLRMMKGIILMSWCKGLTLAIRML